MIAFTIEPYVGALPIRFGMNPAEVSQIIGPPSEVSTGPFGNRCEQRECLALGYSTPDGTFMEAVFAPGAKVLYHGHDLFEHPDPIQLLRQFDPAPQLWVGFVIFQRLGVRLSGFHDNDESQKAIAVVKEGYWDQYTEDFVPFI